MRFIQLAIGVALVVAPAIVGAQGVAPRATSPKPVHVQSSAAHHWPVGRALAAPLVPSEGSRAGVSKAGTSVSQAHNSATRPSAIKPNTMPWVARQSSRSPGLVGLSGTGQSTHSSTTTLNGAAVHRRR